MKIIDFANGIGSFFADKKKSTEQSIKTAATKMVSESIEAKLTELINEKFAGTDASELNINIHVTIDVK